MECRNPALFLAGEAANVIAALRSNLKFNRYAVRAAGVGSALACVAAEAARWLPSSAQGVVRC